ncbi:MAG: M3 family metallopeptidase [Halobacteriovoraceae bacterium]|nr:M3 family metallopeptidase [Halobacteriovoraceae bacterium]MCB9095358.1 M3 family metallopeptidase [Halobacteriovoraceae bacterium]
MQNLLGLLSVFLIFNGCGDHNNKAGPVKSFPKLESKDCASTNDNPFFEPSSLQYGYPEFDKIEDSDFLSAFECGFKQEIQEVEAIANQTETPTFANTIVAMEKTGQLLHRVESVFYALKSANTNDEIDAINKKVAPLYASHSDKINLNKKLFSRVSEIYKKRKNLGLNEEEMRLIEESYRRFVRAGALLSEDEKKRVKEINVEFAVFQDQFDQNVLNEVNDSAVVVESKEELRGLSEKSINQAAAEAKSRGLDGKFVITLVNTSPQPILAELENRDLREKIYKASLARGSRGNEFDNRETFIEMIKLRAEKAKLLGYKTHAAYVLDEQTAKTVEAAKGMLSKLAPKAVANAKKEAEVLQQAIVDDGKNFELEAWDWAYYAEKVRKKIHNFDESQLAPYFELDSVLINGAFFAANKLYGLSFKKREDFPTYQEDVRVYEVFDYDGKSMALFVFDPYARGNKQGGAWMSSYVSQSKLMGTHPVVANHLNIKKPVGKDEPTLLSFYEVTTLFHEFGHALHGMLSNVQFPSFSGTSVPSDFVEYPSQVNEMWAVWPEVLKNYAIHYQTGAPMPTELLDKVLASQKFNQGYDTTSYLAAALLDLSWHQLTLDQIPSADELVDFEKNALKSEGVLMNVVPVRYRTPYFSHIAAGYAAGYYSYIWSEVLDADTVEWFHEKGGLKRENGDIFRNKLLSRGGSRDPVGMFVDFRGHSADITPLLKRKGLN